MVRIRFESIEVEKLSDSSSIQSGVNVIVGRTSRDETNEGFGSIGGCGNRAEGGRHAVRTGRPAPRTQGAD
ncbi:hypothetical protein [Paenibacillus flagellatus]|uniref:Uncharacterized protein n=1 Tax=Paenibacillus flagellatus TaxID=2211139 RepID=A0A2V5KZD3_9BACL|nr:hypothetical protein [Paenibacillus flagellatus]PYI55456.1 hypothetical protein DLM86_06895 [Paenibacillus flagellatus]